MSVLLVLQVIEKWPQNLPTELAQHCQMITNFRCRFHHSHSRRYCNSAEYPSAATESRRTSGEWEQLIATSRSTSWSWGHSRPFPFPLSSPPFYFSFPSFNPSPTSSSSLLSPPITPSPSLASLLSRPLLSSAVGLRDDVSFPTESGAEPRPSTYFYHFDSWNRVWWQQI